MRIALQRKRGGSFDFWRSKGVLDEFNERALKLVADVGLRDFAEWTAVELPYGRKRALELATTIAPFLICPSASRAGSQTSASSPWME